MSSLQPNSTPVTPVYVTGRELNRRLRGAYLSDFLQIADDLHSGRLVISNISARQAKQLAKCVAAITAAIGPAANV